MSSGLNFNELAQEHPEEARRLALLAQKKMAAVTQGAVAHGTAVAQGKAAGIPSIVTDMPGQGDLTAIPWPDVPDFQHNHHTALAKLAYHIATWLSAAKMNGGEKLAQDDFLAVKAAGSLYALGRTKPWPGKDDHRSRSAALAEEVMHKDPGFWGNPKVRAEACKLIAAMRDPTDLANDPPTDPRLLALWDAECYEQCRFGVGTREGIQSMAAGFKRAQTAWGREPANQESWRRYRGWK